MVDKMSLREATLCTTGICAIGTIAVAYALGMVWLMKNVHWLFGPVAVFAVIWMAVFASDRSGADRGGKGVGDAKRWTWCHWVMAVLVFFAALAIQANVMQAIVRAECPCVLDPSAGADRRSVEGDGDG